MESSELIDCDVQYNVHTNHDLDACTCTCMQFSHEDFFVVKMPSHTRALRDRNHAEKLNDSCINESQDIECVEHQGYFLTLHTFNISCDLFIQLLCM